MSTFSVNVTGRQVSDAVNAIATANHCQAGAVIALSGALAAALGQAVANGTLAEGSAGTGGSSAGADAARHAARHAARQMQLRLTEIRARFLALADQDATAIGEFVRLRESGQALKGYELLCDGPRDMAVQALAAASFLQDFRTHVSERTHDDLEFAITLMSGVAHSAMQLLDSNLRIWPLPELVAKYDPAVNALVARIDALQPVERIRR